MHAGPESFGKFRNGGTIPICTVVYISPACGECTGVQLARIHLDVDGPEHAAENPFTSCTSVQCRDVPFAARLVQGESRTECCTRVHESIEVAVVHSIPLSSEVCWPFRGGFPVGASLPPAHCSKSAGSMSRYIRCHNSRIR